MYIMFINERPVIASMELTTKWEARLLIVLHGDLMFIRKLYITLGNLTFPMGMELHMCIGAGQGQREHALQ